MRNFLPMSITRKALLVLALSGGLLGVSSAAEMETMADERGEHNGRLLHEGNFTVELAIFEQGVPPEFRAWAYQDDREIGLTNWSLAVELTRLGGEITRYAFEPAQGFLRGQGVVGEPHSFDVQVTASYQGRQYQWQYESHEGRMSLSSTLARELGVTTAVAGPGELNQTLLLYGKTSPDPQQVSHVMARYPGLIREIGPTLGDTVDRDETIATIEANNSLQTYDIKAPINGMVVEKHANPGEMTGESVLLTIANYSNLWVDLTVFPGDASSIRPGMPVTIQMDGYTQQSSIRYLNPGEGNSPAVTARVMLPNPDMRWSPGLLVEGLVSTAKIPVALMIDNRALQTFRDWQVVFIRIGDSYEIRPLTLGRTDGEYTEVLDGLSPGDNYVVDNSYLIKADLEKDGATHDH
jgi:cobalt-zinc-cadmium efflux system membrane fusion protein